MTNLTEPVAALSSPPEVPPPSGPTAKHYMRVLKRMARSAYDHYRQVVVASASTLSLLAFMAEMCAFHGRAAVEGYAAAHNGLFATWATVGSLWGMYFAKQIAGALRRLIHRIRQEAHEEAMQ